MLRYKGILFDLDGTLLDTYDLIMKSFQHTFRTHYNREIDPAEVHAFFSKPLIAALRSLAPEEHAEQLLHTYREYNLRHHDELAGIFAGMAEVVQELYAAGAHMAIVTSKTRQTALRGLRLFDLDKYFPVVIGFDEVEHHKPHPEPVLNAVRLLGLEPADCIMVGDGPADIASARAAGVTAAAVRWTQAPWELMAAERPDVVFETTGDILLTCGVEPAAGSNSGSAGGQG